MKMLSVLFRRVFRTEFPCIDKCDTIGLNHTVVADFYGTLLRGRSSFPYFAVLAFEFGGWLRLLGLVVVAPLAGLLYYLVSESAAIQVLVFATFAGVKADEIESVSRAVLPKFYSEDLHSGAWKIFSACCKRYVLTANPRVMVEPFLKEFLGVDMVIGTELASYNGRATGFVKSPGVMVGAAKAEALVSTFGYNGMPDVGLGDRASDYPFLRLCKEGYMVPTSPAVEAVSRDKLPKAVIFHDGRLVKAPTLLGALILVLWIPVGFLLACIRIAAGALLPMSIVYYAFWALGVKVFIKGNCPSGSKSKGVLFVCTHKTLLDPIFVSVALKRPVSAVVYSVSRLSEFLSPIKTFRISRDRVKDANMIKRLLQQGDLVICPEGTTCREPFLLRFSALFAELTDQIVPVAVNNKMSMFHGTTARGWKGMDPFFFFMNPSPSYELVFMNQLPLELTCSGGKTSVEVANYIQKLLAGVLKYQCTAYTRKDKYKELAGTDGIVR